MPRIIKTSKNPKRTYSQGGARGNTQLQRDGDFEFGASQLNINNHDADEETHVDDGEKEGGEDGVEEEQEDGDDDGDGVIVLGGLPAVSVSGRVSITPGPSNNRSRKRMRSSVTPIIADEVEKEDEMELNDHLEDKEEEDNDDDDDNHNDDTDTGFRKRRSSKAKMTNKKKKKRLVARKPLKVVPPKEMSRKNNRSTLTTQPELNLSRKADKTLPVDDNDIDGNVSFGHNTLVHDKIIGEVNELPTRAQPSLRKKSKRNPVEVPFGNIDRVTNVLSLPISAPTVANKPISIEQDRSLPKAEQGPLVRSAPLPPVDPRVAQKAIADAILVEERQRIPRFELGVIIGRNKKLTAVPHGGRANLLTVAWVLGERIEGRRRDECMLKQIIGARWRELSGKKQNPLSFGGAVSSEKLMDVFGAGNVLILKATDDLINILAEAEHVPHPDFVSVFADSSRLKQSELQKIAVSTYSVGVRTQENEVCAPSILDLYIDANSSDTTGSFEARKQLFHLRKVSSEEQVLQTNIEFRFILVAFHEQSRELYYALENRSNGESWSSTVSQARAVVKKSILQTVTDSRKGGPVSFEVRAPVKKPVSSRSMSKFAERKANSMARAALVDEVLATNQSINNAESSESRDFLVDKETSGKSSLNRGGKSISAALIPTKDDSTSIQSKPSENIQSQWIDKFVLGSEDADEFKTYTGQLTSGTTFPTSHLLMSTIATTEPLYLSHSNSQHPQSLPPLPPPPPPQPPSRMPPQKRSQSQAAFRMKRLAEQKAKEDAEMSEFDVTALAAIRESGLERVSVFSSAKPVEQIAPTRIETSVPADVAKPFRRFTDLKKRSEKQSDYDIFDDLES
jgi:hypothetical protein